MSDHYVLLLERVVEENKALREQMKQMADNEKAVLGDLHKKIDCLQSQKLFKTYTSRLHYAFQNSARYVYIVCLRSLKRIRKICVFMNGKMELYSKVTLVASASPRCRLKQLTGEKLQFVGFLSLVFYHMLASESKQRAGMFIKKITK